MLFDEWEKMVHIYWLRCTKWMSCAVFSCNILCLKDESVNSEVIGSSLGGQICTHYEMVARETKQQQQQQQQTKQS